MTEQQIKVLREINDSVPKIWWKQLSRKAWANPVVRKLVDKGLNDPDVDFETRKKLKLLQISDEYSATVDFIDEKIEKKIDEFLTRKVRQATKSGRLPPLKQEDLNVRKPRKESNETTV